MNTLVSVIIPCHNAEAYIGECIESVINQTYKKIEVICVENNSTDNTYNLLNVYANKYAGRVRVIKETKSGASIARNTGLALAKGEWIQFLDADDILLPQKINVQLNLIMNQNVDLIVGNYNRTENSVTEKVNQINLKWEGLIKGRLGFTSSNLWKRDTVLRVGGWDNIKSSQEAYLMFKILKEKGELVFDEEYNTVKMERNKNSISKTNVKENVMRYIECRIDIWEHLKTSGELSDDILKVLKINIFDSIRILYKENNEAGTIFYSKYVTNKFSPISSSSTSPLYLILLRMMGFRMTQNLLG